MEDKFEKKFKSFLPYIIIIAAVYLFLPALLAIFSKNQTTPLTYIILIGILPLTALLCCFHYAYKKENDFFLSLVAPIIFIPSMFLYRLFMYSWITSLIYLISYFICGYIGLILGEIISKKNKKSAKEIDGKIKTHNKHPKKVNINEDASNDSFQEDFADELDTDTTTTTEDINAILENIHNRHNNE